MLHGGNVWVLLQWQTGQLGILYACDNQVTWIINELLIFIIGLENCKFYFVLVDAPNPDDRVPASRKEPVQRRV